MNFTVASLVFLFAFSAVAQKSEGYEIPVLFDFKNSISKAEYGFAYDLLESELVLENLGRINDKTFSMRFLFGADARKVPEGTGRGSLLEVTLPSGFFSEFDVQLINKSGKLLTTKFIKKEMLARFSGEKGLGKTTRFVLGDIDSILQKIAAEKEPIKLCVTQKNDKFFTRLCSKTFGIVDKNKEIKYESKSDVNSRVLIENEVSPMKHSIRVKNDVPIRAFFELKGGVVFEMMNRPRPVEFIEVTEEGANLKFFGVGSLPIGAVKKERQSISFLNNLIPFDSTIGDFRDYYHFTIPAASMTPTIVIEGQGGGLFQYYLTLNKVPKESDRVYFKDDTPNATYLDSFKLYGSSEKKVKFKSQNAIEESENNNNFIWTTNLSKKGDFNIATLDYEKDGVTNRAYFEIYRGFSQEFSLKVTGISTAKQFVTLGEVSYNKWFEDFGTRPGSLLYQRLGVGLTYFKSFNQIEIDDQGTKATLESTNLSMKYRFTPGLWNWDESWGAILAYQSLKYEELNAPLAGIGVFWARSMPVFFDSIFNLIPFFRYPKWVDMDLIYYPTSLDSKIKTSGSMALNFHGKILWTKKIYGEAGFGYKSFALETKDLGTDVRSMYLTVGLGLNF